ncbi:MAG: NAD-dependent epimerase/dehydratase family protein, partial [Burkholderiaceae bacterium]
MSAVQRVVITGAAGFIGQRLCRELRSSASIARDADEWVATDLTRPEGDPAGCIVGDIADPLLIDKLFERPVHRLFHLAGIVSGRAEADFALGKRVNLDATLALLERCRLQTERGGPVVRFVYASSIAVFGTPRSVCS